MRGEIHAFDPREGGEVQVSLTYETEEGFGAGKSSADTDTFHGRFLAFKNEECITLGVTFEADDPALTTPMTVSFILVDAPSGTTVTCLSENIPAGISLEDNETGSRSSLENLRRLLEAAELR